MGKGGREHGRGQNGTDGRERDRKEVFERRKARESALTRVGQRDTHTRARARTHTHVYEESDEEREREGRRQCALGQGTDTQEMRPRWSVSETRGEDERNGDGTSSRFQPPKLPSLATTRWVGDGEGGGGGGFASRVWSPGPFWPLFCALGRERERDTRKRDKATGLTQTKQRLGSKTGLNWRQEPP